MGGAAIALIGYNGASNKHAPQMQGGNNKGAVHGATYRDAGKQ